MKGYDSDVTNKTLDILICELESNLTCMRVLDATHALTANECAWARIRMPELFNEIMNRLPKE